MDTLAASPSAEVRSSSNACGPEVGGGACYNRIYPKEVVKMVRQKMKSLVLDPAIPVLVPQRMELDDRMKAANWKDAAMIELRIHDDNRLVQEIDVLRSREMVQKHSGNYGTLSGFEIFGVVKETGVDDEGLAEFSNTYYGKYPLYCDKSYSLYQALGDRKALELPSLWTLLTSFMDAWRRMSSKGIQWNVKGEGIVKGGLIIFDAKGNPKYAYKEEMGEDLPIQDLVKALEAVRRESNLNLVVRPE